MNNTTVLENRGLETTLPIRIDEVWVHYNADFDDMSALTAIFDIGSENVLGESALEVHFKERSEVMQYLKDQNTTPSELMERGIWILGMAGSDTDEHAHPNNGNVAQPNECAATLTSKIIGIRSEAWNKILAYTMGENHGQRLDLGSDLTRTLPNLIKAGYIFNNEEENCRWITENSIRLISNYHKYLETQEGQDDPGINWSLKKLLWICELLGEETEWIEEVRSTFNKFHANLSRQKSQIRKLVNKIKVLPIKTRYGKIYFSAIKHESTVFHASLFKHGGENQRTPDIVVMFRESGNCQIFTRTGLKIPLTNIAAQLRAMEVSKMGKKIPKVKHLRADGEIPGYPEWVLFKGFIFNGSNTATDVKPTILTPSEIVSCLHLGLHPDYIDPVEPKCFTAKIVGKSKPSKDLLNKERMEIILPRKLGTKTQLEKKEKNFLDDQARKKEAFNNRHKFTVSKIIVVGSEV